MHLSQIHLALSLVFSFGHVCNRYKPLIYYPPAIFLFWAIFLEKIWFFWVFTAIIIDISHPNQKINRKSYSNSHLTPKNSKENTFSLPNSTLFSHFANPYLLLDVSKFLNNHEVAVNSLTFA